jgi:hypothetical protein
MSRLPAHQLPTSLNNLGAEHICTVESDLPQDMKRKNRHWYSTRPQYLRADFEMQVLVGPADLKFRTLNREGVLSKDHENIHVDWVSSMREAMQPIVAELEGCTSPHMMRKGQRWSRLKHISRRS